MWRRLRHGRPPDAAQADSKLSRSANGSRGLGRRGPGLRRRSRCGRAGAARRPDIADQRIEIDRARVCRAAARAGPRWRAAARRHGPAGSALAIPWSASCRGTGHHRDRPAGAPAPRPRRTDPPTLGPSDRCDTGWRKLGSGGRPSGSSSGSMSSGVPSLIRPHRGVERVDPAAPRAHRERIRRRTPTATLPPVVDLGHDDGVFAQPELVPVRQHHPAVARGRLPRAVDVHAVRAQIGQHHPAALDADARNASLTGAGPDPAAPSRCPSRARWITYPQ